MKTKLLGIILFTSHLAFSIPFQDDFSGSAVDQTLWQVQNPFSDSSVTQAGGFVTLRNGGHLTSIESFSAPYEVNGRFRITGNIHDVFVFGIRTTGEWYPHSHEFLTGLNLRIHKQNDPGTIENSVIFQRQDNGSSVLADATIPFNLGEFYDFRIQDFGDTVSVFFKDLTTPLFTINDTLRLGGRIGMYNREGVGGGSSISDGSTVDIDYIRVDNIVSVPDSLPQFALAITVGALILLKRHQA